MEGLPITPVSRDAEVQLLQRLALDIGQAEDLDRVLRSVLEAIGRSAGWVAGESWLPDRSGGVMLRGPVWSGGCERLEAFHAVSHGMSFARGRGLIGQVWASGAPCWIGDVTRDPEFRRSEAAAEAGLKTAAAIPVLVEREVVAVLVYFHSEERPYDRRLMQLVSAVAAQLGMLVRRKRAEDALLRKAEELARANAELQRFIWLASHELNEPLRMVTLYTQWLSDRCEGRLSPEENEAIGFAREGAERMHGLLEAFRTYAEAGSRAEKVRPVNLDQVLERALTALQRALEDRAADVRWESLPEVIGAPAELEFVFEQLLHNALTFRTPDVPPRIVITAEARDSMWVISVQDNGIGIPVEHQGRVFEAFPRLHARGAYPGSGVGLAICRKIIERLGGRIWLESAEGRGSTFRFSLPGALAPREDPVESDAILPAAAVG